MWPFKKKEVKPPAIVPGHMQEAKPKTEGLSEIDRVTNYFASGGEIVDLSNKPRLPNDGFPSDQAMMQPWNQAHTGTKKGLASMAKRDRR